MRALALAALAFTTVGAAGQDVPAAAVEVKEILSTTVTAGGQPLVLPTGTVRLIASTYVIPKAAALPVHKHPFPRYAYVLAGTIKVTNADTGKSDTFKTGDFIVEMVDQWHQGSNIGADPVKLLVIDQIEAGAQATILKQ